MRFSELTKKRFFAKVELYPVTGCHVWTGAKSRGYGVIRVTAQLFRAHRIALALAGIKIPRGKLGLHKCHNRACVNVLHLYVGTQSQNVVDAVRARSLHNLKLTPETVRVIRKLAQTWRHVDLARQFNVTQSEIYHVVRRDLWRHVVDDEQAE